MTLTVTVALNSNTINQLTALHDHGFVLHRVYKDQPTQKGHYNGKRVVIMAKQVVTKQKRSRYVVIKSRYDHKMSL